VLNEARREQVELLGPHDVLMLGTINSLGELYLDQNRLDEAEVAFQQVLEGCTTPGHILMLMARVNLGIVYRKKGNLNAA
jgi:tetratricopeptide (TPR) repeat protein